MSPGPAPTDTAPTSRSRTAPPNPSGRPPSGPGAGPPPPSGPPPGWPPAPPPAAPGPAPPPRERPEASPALLGRAVLAGVLAALLLPGHRLGAGVVVAGLAVAASVRVRARRPTDVALAGLGAALLAVAALRDAGWLVALCLLAAAACWSLLLSRGDGGPGVALGVVSVALRWWRAPVLLMRPMRRLGSSERRSAALPVLRGLAVSVVLLTVFGLLFASADTAVASLLERLTVPAPSALLAGRGVLGVAVALLVGAGALTAHRPVGRTVLAPAKDRLVRAVEWALPLVLLDLLVAGFVLVQLTVLFGGRDHVLTTAGLSYAEYARQGFGQLVVVALLTLAVVALAVRLVPTRPPLLRVLLGVLCALTLVVLASASRRLGLYETELGFTRLRLSVDGAIGWLGAVLLLVLAGLVLGRFGWLPRAVVLSAALGLLVFAVADPDARIATHNLERAQSTGRLDLAYLSRLSADAAPALRGIDPCMLRQVVPAEPDPWWNTNLARYRARALPLPPCVD